MPMKNIIAFNCILTVLSLPFVCYAQQLRPPVEYAEKEDYEKPDDPYLPNAYNNKKLSPAYTYDCRSNPRTGNTEIFTRQVNVNQDQQNIIGDAANEPNIAVNPLNENEIVIGWRQFDNVLSNFRQAGWAHSSDGGQTWTFPGTLNPGVFQSDPVLDYDNSGHFYYNSLMSSASGYPCYIYNSTNGGMSWNNSVYIGGGDKQWMTIDRSGGIGEGNIYSSWSPVLSDCLPGIFTRSTDGGNTFDACSDIPKDPTWGTEAVGNNGELYIVGQKFPGGGLIVAKSTDAQDPTQSVSWDQVTNVYLGGGLRTGGINPDGLIGQLYIDVDRSNGPARDNVYVVGSVRTNFQSDQADVKFTRSADGGATWYNFTPIRINDDMDTTNTQWFGTMSVAPNGRIDVIWLDTRDHPGSDSSALYYSFSIDQGSTWSANEKLSDTFDPHIGYPNQQKMGDYFDMISNNTGAHLAWVHTLNGEQDIYYSFITPPALTGAVDVSENLKVTVHPNPTSGLFEVSCSDKNLSIEIFTAVGQKIFLSSGSDTKHVIDISSQPAGMYFLKLISEDNRMTVTKIIRQ